MSCDHESIEFTGTMQVVDPEGDQEAEGNEEWRYITLLARCADCKGQYHFRGVSSGEPNPDLPMASADGYELRAPVRFGPGAVVGLLVNTGLEDRLVDPDHEPRA